MTVVPLAAVELGEGPPLIVLHGLLGQGRNWQGIARRLGDLRRVLLVDQRNHGASPWADGMTYPALAGDVIALLDAQGIASADLLGHSMGGKTAMAAALLHPDRVRSLVVVDIAPVPYRHRSFDRYVEAMRAMDLAAVGRRDDADRMLAPVEPDPFVRGFLLQNLENREGVWRWRSNLAGLLAAMPDLLGWPDALDRRRYPGPVLVIAGGRSHYVEADGEARLKALFPALRLERLDSAGHWPHAERPDEVLALLRAFLGERR